MNIEWLPPCARETFAAERKHYANSYQQKIMPADINFYATTDTWENVRKKQIGIRISTPIDIGFPSKQRNGRDYEKKRLCRRKLQKTIVWYMLENRIRNPVFKLIIFYPS